MTFGKKIRNRRFVLLRVESTRALKTLKVYLTMARTWTQNHDLAREGSYSDMKSLMVEMKMEFPDIIIEECSELEAPD